MCLISRHDARDGDLPDMARGGKPGSCSLDCKPTKSQKTLVLLFKPWLAAKKTARAIFILACPSCRDFGVWVVLSVPIDPSSSCEGSQSPWDQGSMHLRPATCTWAAAAAVLLLFCVPGPCPVVPSDCMYFAAALQRSCGDPAAQLLAQRRGQTLLFFFCRDEKWYPDLARCDGSCRISFTRAHTHTHSLYLFSPLA